MWGIGEMLFKGTDLPLVDLKSPGDLTHSIAIIVNSPVLQTSKLLKD